MADLTDKRDAPPPVQCEALVEGGRCPNPAQYRRSHWHLCRECRKRPAYRLEARVLPGGKIETAPSSAPRRGEGA